MSMYLRQNTRGGGRRAATPRRSLEQTSSENTAVGEYLYTYVTSRALSWSNRFPLGPSDVGGARRDGRDDASRGALVRAPSRGARARVARAGDVRAGVPERARVPAPLSPDLHRRERVFARAGVDRVRLRRRARVPHVRRSRRRGRDGRRAERRGGASLAARRDAASDALLAWARVELEALGMDVSVHDFEARDGRLEATRGARARGATSTRSRAPRAPGPRGHRLRRPDRRARSGRGDDAIDSGLADDAIDSGSLASLSSALAPTRTRSRPPPSSRASRDPPRGSRRTSCSSP